MSFLCARLRLFVKSISKLSAVVAKAFFDNPTCNYLKWCKRRNVTPNGKDELKQD